MQKQDKFGIIYQVEEGTHMKKNIMALLLITILFMVSGCQTPVEKYSVKVFYLDEAFSIVPTVSLIDKEELIAGITDLKDQLNAVTQALNQTYSVFITDSDISEINRQAGVAPVEVSEEFISILQQAISISELTIVQDVALYDITILPVWETWDFSNRYYDFLIDNIEEIPTPEAIEEKMELVDYRKIIIDEEASTVFLQDVGMKIDLGSVIKGYACDQLREVLVANGFFNGVIDVGGNIMTMGHTRRDNQNVEWDIKIRTPYISMFSPNYNETKAIGQIPDTDVTVVTSGVYERYIMAEGYQEYHHILDPRTGYPMDNGLWAVTIITEESALADALSTAIFNLGLEQGMAVVETLPTVEAIFVLSNKEIYVSSGLHERFVFNAGIVSLGYTYKGVYDGTDH